MSLTIGDILPTISGNVTQLKAVILADFRQTEINIGYHAGRLSQGYTLLLLKSMPQPDDFELHGTTLRSGGRFGLPGETQAQEDLRGSVHGSILQERGAHGYRNMQEGGLRHVALNGPDRLVKILPTTRHDGGMSAAAQYPMGGGFLQWDLKKPGLPFLCAAEFRSDGTVKTKDQVYRINSGDFLTDYPEREKLQRFLQQA
ncbi:hypothetical protein [uncultured Roseibium sp.]|uniref:hypothetical protein n=1 Tax=uncultured Roseibium sp. TaxID=1936171 RepID=UPI0026042C69|nr:hypothetical protein [uncultured Roseibium sp.]